MGQPGADSAQGKECNGVASDCNGGASPAKHQLQGKEALRYANILRSRNKFADALQLYNVVLEKEGTNVEALIGKGICLQAQSLPRQAIECFTEAVKIEPENACALTHCGMIYKDEGHLVEAAEVFSTFIFACLLLLQLTCGLKTDLVVTAFAANISLRWMICSNTMQSQ
jgi:protein O-GlcNAc transferase